MPDTDVKSWLALTISGCWHRSVPSFWDKTSISFSISRWAWTTCQLRRHERKLVTVKTTDIFNQQASVLWIESLVTYWALKTSSVADSWWLLLSSLGALALLRWIESEESPGFGSVFVRLGRQLDCFLLKMWWSCLADLLVSFELEDCKHDDWMEEAPAALSSGLVLSASSFFGERTCIATWMKEVPVKNKICI